MVTWLEWLGESYNRGPIGTVDIADRARPGRPRIAVLTCFAISAALLGGWAWLSAALRADPLWVTFGTLVYLILGYFLHPQPDYSNVGWLGGVFDHPFRYSDDINRFLIFLTIALWPGRFVAESLVDTVRLLANARTR